MNALTIAALGVLAATGLAVVAALAWLELMARRQRRAHELDRVRAELRSMRAAMRVSMAARNARRLIVQATHGADEPQVSKREWSA